MANQNTVVQYSFSTGIVSPGIRNRHDWQRIDGAIAEGKNGTIIPSGGFRKRPGSIFINEALSDEMPVRLVPFVFTLDQTYMLEFCDGRVRFYQGHGVILDADGEEYVIDSPYVGDEVLEFKYAQDRDVLLFAHEDKPLKRLTRYGHANWVWSDHFTDESTSRLPSPSWLRFYEAGSDGHNGYEYAVTAYRIVGGTPEESLSPPTLLADPNTVVEPITEAPNRNISSLVTWDTKYRPIWGQQPGYVRVPDILNPFTISRDQTAPRTSAPAGAVGGVNQHIWNMFQTYHPDLGQIFNWSFLNTAQLRIGAWTMSNTAGAALRADSRYQYYSNMGSGSSDIGKEWAAYCTGLDDTWIMLTHARSYVDGDRINSNGRTMTDVYNDMMTFINNHNSNISVKLSNHIAWNKVAGADGYYIYRRYNESQDRNFYLIETITDPDVTDWLEEDVTETVPGTKTPIAGDNDFTSPDNYPRVVTFYQQRLVLGSTKANPQTIYGSRTGIYTDFTINPTDDASGYEFKMASQEANPITYIMPLQTLVILTGGGDFVSTIDGAMNQSNVNFNQRSYNGSSDVVPIIVGSFGLYVPVSQKTIHTIEYDALKAGFSQDDILFNAQSLVRNKRLRRLCYQRSPINLIWALDDEGQLLSSFFVPEQEFNAWTRHETKGFVTEVQTLTDSSGIDELWQVCERTLGDGTVRRYIEILDDMEPYRDALTAENMNFVDCGLSAVFPSPVQTLTGLEHLEGCEVAILRDGSIDAAALEKNQPPVWKTVENGAVVLDEPASAVHVGLPYASEFETIDLNLQSGETLRDTKASIETAFIEVADTRELRYSVNGGTEYPVIVHGGDEDTFSEPQMQDGDIRIDDLSAKQFDGTRLKIRSILPLPQQINSLVMRVKRGAP